MNYTNKESQTIHNKLQLIENIIKKILKIKKYQCKETMNVLNFKENNCKIHEIAMNYNLFNMPDDNRINYELCNTFCHSIIFTLKKRKKNNVYIERLVFTDNRLSVKFYIF